MFDIKQGIMDDMHVIFQALYWVGHIATDNLPISVNWFLLELICLVVAIVLNSTNSDNRAATLSSGSLASWSIVSTQ